MQKTSRSPDFEAKQLQKGRSGCPSKTSGDMLSSRWAKTCDGLMNIRLRTHVLLTKIVITREQTPGKKVFKRKSFQQKCMLSPNYPQPSISWGLSSLEFSILSIDAPEKLEAPLIMTSYVLLGHFNKLPPQYFFYYGDALEILYFTDSKDWGQTKLVLVLICILCTLCI